MNLADIRDKYGKIIRFISVGILNTIVGYAIYALLIWLNLPPQVALLLSTIAGVTFNYFSIGRLVFQSQGGLTVFIRFIASYCVVYVVNAQVLSFLIKSLHMTPYLAQALCVPLNVAASWLLMNHWVFTKAGLRRD